MQFTLGQLSSRVEEYYSNNSNTLVVDISMTRMYFYHVVTTYFPTMCLQVISCLTLFIDPSHFEATVGLSMTTLLVVQTLQSTINSALPKTPYTKLIDIWLIYGMAGPFFVFLVLVGIEMLPKETDLIEKASRSEEPTNNKRRPRKKLTKEKVHRWFQRVIPSFAFLFTLGYFSACCYIVNM